MPEDSRGALRVAFVAGTLGQGGAEKQLVYMVRALLDEGVHVRVFTMTQGPHERALKDVGVEPIWLGRHARKVNRLISLVAAVRKYRPHVIQSAHFYTNLYAGLTAPVVRAIAIGAIRNDMAYEMEANPFWGKWLLRRVDALIANSYGALGDAGELGVAQERLTCVPNVIDLTGFDSRCLPPSAALQPSIESRPVVASIGRLVRAKRFDRFIEALALARQQVPELSGCIVGDGPERESLQALARQKGLSEEHMVFLGRRDDTPAILSQVQMLALTSDHEGFPNVLLEAMAASLPVVTTPAGDSGRVVLDGVTGYVQPFEDVRGLAGRMSELAQSPQLRDRLGQEGRRRVEREYSGDGLSASLLSVYLKTARRCRSQRLIKALASS